MHCARKFEKLVRTTAVSRSFTTKYLWNCEPRLSH
ncbi:hypothetical protein LINPERHAP1_LOCUS32132 [Linum perenne]